MQDEPNKEARTQQIVIVAAAKSVGAAIALSALFGPLGMLYSTVTGACVMFVVSILVALLTFGFGLFITWPVCIVWSVMATNAHNSRLVGASRSAVPVATT